MCIRDSRRTDGRMIPIDEIKKISEYCRSKNIKLHLDGARIYMASAWSGVSINEYSTYFDTVYISLYKYLGASGGAILCGDKALIEKMPHMIKIHGGNMLSLIHISEPTRLLSISYAVFCLKKKK